jgi:hypothetical protein
MRIEFLWESRKKPIRRPRHMWGGDNIKISVTEIGLHGMDWIDLAQNKDQWGALLNTVVNFRVP